MIPPEWLDQAALRVAPHIRRTELMNVAELNIYIKWENRQVTGSFKVRGALNKVLTLNKWEQAAGLVTASAGNHGQGVALAGKLVNAKVLVFTSKHSVPTKIDAMRTLGADVQFVDGGYEKAEMMAIRVAREQRRTWISPYNDGQVVAGQGTIGLEIAADLQPDSSQTWVVPVGGGGLLAGIGAALERYPSRPKLIGVNASESAFMHSIFHYGTQENVNDNPTLAEGLSGAVEENSLTIPLVRKYADDLICVSEEQISGAIAFCWNHYNERIEGSAAAAFAAVLVGMVSLPAVLIVTGGNIQPEVHADICKHSSEIE